MFTPDIYWPHVYYYYYYYYYYYCCCCCCCNGNLLCYHGVVERLKIKDKIIITIYNSSRNAYKINQHINIVCRQKGQLRTPYPTIDNCK